MNDCRSWGCFIFRIVEVAVTIVSTSKTCESEAESTGPDTYLVLNKNSSYCYGLLCSCFRGKKWDGRNREQVGVSTLKNESCQLLFLGHDPHVSWNQARPHLERRAFCLQCVFSTTVWTTITSSDNGDVGAKMTSSFHRTGRVQWQREEPTHKVGFKLAERVHIGFS